MKLSDIKHNHSLTDLLKIFIFSILMLLPFLSVLTRCMYVTFNKNAYQSYSGTSITYERTPKYVQGDVNNGLEVGKIYHFDIEDDFLIDIFNNPQENFDLVFKPLNTQLYDFNNLNGFYVDDFQNQEEDNLFNNQNEINIEIRYYDIAILTHLTNNQDYSIYLYSNDSPMDYSFSYKGDVLIISMVGVTLLDTSLIYNTAYQEYEYTAIESSTLDNVFEYSFQKMSQDDMFNWTQNTALYSGIHAMTTNLQIQTNVIAILLTYWTILTIIYVIIDIVLKCFTLLTHGFSRKTS